jgi:hypothetical protein
MPAPIKPTEQSARIRFGGGVHSAAAEDEINEREASRGENFQLDPEARELTRRSPFDLVGTATNGQRINGFACRVANNGDVSLLVQAGVTVYNFGADRSFTSVGTVSASARLRGHWQRHNWPLATEKVLIVDIALAEVVKYWDGTTFDDVAFVNEDGSTTVSSFAARYLIVDNERAIFANVKDGATAYPHLIVGSARGNYAQITVANRPSSSLSAADPFFLVQPDNRYINGILGAFGIFVISSQQGSIYQMSGTDATDFAISPLYAESGVSGDEGFEYIGNDVIFGRLGRIESLQGVNQFGDVVTADPSLPIKDDIETFRDWLIVYNRRFQRVYCHPVGKSRIWVLHRPLVGTGLSPWVKWTTRHDMSFNPTCLMSVLDPADRLEYTFMGDDSGNIYKLEGSGSGDGGTTS